MDNTLFLLLLGLTILFVLTQLALFLFFIKSFNEFRKNHNPDEEALKKFKQKSEDILRSTIAKANDIITDAQKKGVEILSKEEQTGGSLSAEYTKHLGAIEEAFKAQFEKSADNANKAYNDFIAQVGHVVNDRIDKNEKILEDRAQEMIKQAHEALEKLSRDTQETIAREAKAELDLAHKEVDEYKQRRMRIIDDRIITMLEDIIKVTLEKKLSLEEQSELVYRALEEAKKENAFG